MASNKNKIKCINCGREISGIKAAKRDGWIIQEDKIFCCCVCINEYEYKSKKKTKR